jgi:hypothetical protein
MLVARGHIENRQAIVRLGFQPYIPQALHVEPKVAVQPFPLQEYRALIDTGAQRTCLCRSIVTREQLVAHAKRPIQNVSGVARHSLFMVQIGFLCETVDELTDPTGARTYFGLPDPIEVIDIADNHWFDAIVGMDVISDCALRIDRDSSFALIIG